MQLIFAARSEYFKKMFLSGLKEAQQKVIEITGDISAPTFLAIREYIVNISFLGHSQITLNNFFSTRMMLQKFPQKLLSPY